MIESSACNSIALKYNVPYCEIGKVIMSIENHTEDIDIKSIRLRLKVNQNEFSDALGLSLETIKSWEQGRRNPTGLANKVLKLIDKDLELYYRFKFKSGNNR